MHKELTTYIFWGVCNAQKWGYNLALVLLFTANVENRIKFNMSDTRIIKKYPNRRLYDTHQSRYITLSNVRELVMEETPFQVIDRQTGEDITRSILLQIIMEQESGGEPLFSNDILAQFIRNYGVTTQQGFTSFLEQSMSMFGTQQEALREQMQKALTNTPLDNWIKLNEKNMQTWQKMQKDMFKGILPDNKDKD